MATLVPLRSCAIAISQNTVHPYSSCWGEASGDKRSGSGSGLEVEQNLPLRARGFKAPMLVVVENRIDDLLRVVHDLEQIQILGIDGAFGDELVLEPIDQPFPEIMLHQNNRDASRLPGLHQRQDLRELIEGAEAAWQDHVRRGVLDEHHLAREKVTKMQGYILIRVPALFMR